MITLKDYQDRFNYFAKVRRDSRGVLTVTMHTNDGPWIFSQEAQDDIAHLFQAIADDRETKIVIFTGTGDGFCPTIDLVNLGPILAGFDARLWFERFQVNGRRSMMAMLNIEAPVILAMNGPTTIHSEIWMPADIRLATPDTFIEDKVYLGGGNTPVVNPVTIWETMLGLAHAKNFHWGQQRLMAKQLLEWGVFTELVERKDILARANAHADRLLQLPELTLRYSRFALNHRLRRAITEDSLGYGYLGVQLLDTLVLNKPGA